MRRSKSGPSRRQSGSTPVNERPGRVVFETTDPAAVREAFDGVAPVTELGEATTRTDSNDGQRRDADVQRCGHRDLRSVIADDYRTNGNDLHPIEVTSCDWVCHTGKATIA